VQQSLEQLADSTAKAGDHALADELRRMADRLGARFGGGRARSAH
jgi:hypothetical protein